MAYIDNDFTPLRLVQKFNNQCMMAASYDAGYERLFDIVGQDYAAQQASKAEQA